VKDESGFSFWARWVLANSAAETVGLGGAFLAGYAIVSLVGAREGSVSALLLGGLAIALGMLEGAIVGAAQGLVLRRRLPGLSVRKWVLGTAAGALVAWTLGMLPSTIMSFGPQQAGPAAADIPDLFVYAAAAGLGAVAGTILASAQWLVLRRHVSKAWRWLPANAAAWMVGMPMTFIAADRIQPQTLPVVIGFSILVAVALAGAVVGAIHGFILTRWLLPRRPPI